MHGPSFLYDGETTEVEGGRGYVQGSKWGVKMTDDQRGMLLSAATPGVND